MPSLPEVLERVQEILGNGFKDFDAVAELIGSDPDLTSQILKIVHPSYYGLPKEVSCTKFAIGLVR